VSSHDIALGEYMEPVIVMAVFATKYGIRRLVDVMGGNDDLGELTGELFGALVESEDLLQRRMVAIERRLDEVLEQPFSTAIRHGLRQLLDASTTTGDHRFAMLERAREQFVAATAAARSLLQEAIAERYVMLCSVAMCRQDAARIALQRAERAAFAVFAQSRAALSGTLRIVDVSGEEGFALPRYESSHVSEAKTLADAWSEPEEISRNILLETDLLADSVGCASRQRLRQPYSPSATSPLVAGTSGEGAADALIGPLRVIWRELRQIDRAEGEQYGSWVSTDRIAAIRVEVEVQTEPGFPVDLLVGIAKPGRQYVRWRQDDYRNMVAPPAGIATSAFRSVRYLGLRGIGDLRLEDARRFLNDRRETGREWSGVGGSGWEHLGEWPVLWRKNRPSIAVKGTRFHPSRSHRDEPPQPIWLMVGHGLTIAAPSLR
jgi:hypothetical protein